MTDKTKCSICGTDHSPSWMGQSGYILCRDCSSDILSFSLQPKMHHNINVLAELFYRKGKGEDITYKDLHEKKSGFKLITFEDLFTNFSSKEKENG